MVSEKTIERLSLYRRILLQVRADGAGTIFSHELAAAVQANAAQVRRDIMQLGCIGVPNGGYRVGDLLDSIDEFLYPPTYQKVALVGVGNLGRAILSHFAGRWRRLSIRAAFDKDPAKVGREFSGCPCHAVEAMPRVVSELGISLGVLAVPAGQAQGAADLLCAAGVKGLLNFAPVRLQAPASVYVENVDLTSALDKVAFFARKRAEEAAVRNAIGTT